jgi:DNA-binding MarR family transcriptional regulator
MSRDISSRQDSVTVRSVKPDRVDSIIDQWQSERPGTNVDGMAIIGRISRLERLIRPSLDAVFAAHALESWEFDVLATLLRSGHPHQLTPGQLLDATMVTSGAMTHRLDRLEERGFVKRSKSRSDGRQVIVSLTAKGVKKIDAALVDHAANELALVSALDSRQQNELVKLLRALSNAIEPMTPAALSSDER